MLCCCTQLRSRKKPQTEDEPTSGPESEEQGLPTRPPPARLPPPSSGLLALTPQSTAARSSLTNPLPGAIAEDSVQLGELIIDDSEDDNAIDTLVRGSRNRSTSTLEAVKARIRRHLSQDSISRQSETEEQIAHRAHVKRLMRKRIQEELQTETDAVDSGSSTPQNPGSTISMFGNGPRDTIEFTVDSAQGDRELSQVKVRSVEDDEQLLSKTMSKRLSARSFRKESCHPNSRPTSLRHWIETDSKGSQPEHDRHPRQRNSLPEIPASPLLHSVRVSSFHEVSSFPSWRLSLSSDKLAELLSSGKSLSVFQPVASPPELCSTVDAFDHQSVRRFRDESSPLVVRSSNIVRACSSQSSLNSAYRRRLPASQSLIRDESPVGLWLRTQYGQSGPSTDSQSQSDCEPGEVQSAENGPECLVDQPCTATSIRSFPALSHEMRGHRSHESLRTACSEVQSKLPPLAYVSTSLAGPHQASGVFLHRNVNFESISRAALAGPSSEQPLAFLVGGNTGTIRNPNDLDITLPAQSIARKGLSGLKLPSFKCRLLDPKLLISLF